MRPNKKIDLPVIRVTRPYLNLLVKPSISFRFSDKYNFMHFERQNCLSKCIKKLYIFSRKKNKLEDLKVLRRSPDLFNNVKIGQGQLLLMIKHYMGLQPFWSSDLNKF